MASLEPLRNLKSSGYAIIKLDLPANLLKNLAQVLRTRAQELDANVALTRRGDLRRNGEAHIFHHPLQWQLRQEPQIYRVFCALHDTHRLWVSFGGAKVFRKGHSAPGFLHWDFDVVKNRSVRMYQGFVALVDEEPGSGCFQCVPGGLAPTNPGFDISSAQSLKKKIMDCGPVTRVALHAGELLVWDARLLHGNASHDGRSERITQFIYYFPERSWDGPLRERRLDLFWNNDLDWAFPGDQMPIRDPVCRPYLNSLGKRLLGEDVWENAPLKFLS